MQKTIIKFFIIILFVISMIACGKKQPIQDIKINCSASTNLNPDIDNRPSPLVILVYQLKRVDIFKNTDFFSLYDEEKKFLNQDLVAQEQIEIQPGQNFDITQIIKSDTKYLGFIAAYRNLEKSKWQYTLELADIKSKNIKIFAGKNEMQINF